MMALAYTQTQQIWILFFAVLLQSIMAFMDTGFDEGGQAPQYCHEFKPECASNEVIVMRTAHFGRMRRGECIAGEYEMGCWANALPVLDRMCSGRRTCVVEVHGLSRSIKSQCHPELIKYLEATYTCMPAEPVLPTRCDMAVDGLSPQEGYINNVISMETERGTSSCPWLIRGLPGQIINITLINFATVSLHNEERVGGSEPRMCYHMASIRDGSDVQSVTECEGGNRLRVAHVSSTESVEISILSSKTSDVHFMLHYTVSGCPQMLPPPGGWISVRDQKATIGCNHTSPTWHLVCNGTHWLGGPFNCTQTHAPAENWDTPDVFNVGSFPYSVLIVVAIGVALGVFCGGLLLACASQRLKSKRRRDDTQRSTSCGIYIGDADKMADDPRVRMSYMGMRDQLCSDGAMTVAHSHIQPTHKLSVDGDYNSYCKNVPLSYPTVKNSIHMYESPQCERKGSDAE